MFARFAQAHACSFHLLLYSAQALSLYDPKDDKSMLCFIQSRSQLYEILVLSGRCAGSVIVSRTYIYHHLLPWER